MTVRGYTSAIRYWSPLLLIYFVILLIWFHPQSVSDVPVVESTNPTAGTPTVAAVKGSSTIRGISPDSVAAQHWQLAGVTMTPTGLDVVHSGLAIVKQDGSPGQNNPPVNLYGTALHIADGFNVTFQLSNIKTEAIIGLYGTPPLVEDEFRAEEGTLSMSVNDSSFGVTISDQPEGTSVEHTQYVIAHATKHILSVADNNGQVLFKLDGAQIGAAISDHDIFAHGVVFFGFNAPQTNGYFHVDRLTIDATNSGSVHFIDTRTQHVPQNPAGLSVLAQKQRPGFQLGASVALGPMIADKKYNQILGNFNAITTENVGKFQTIHPLEGNAAQDYNFADMDAVVAIAQQAGMKIHGHTLVFGEANPAWVQNIAKQSPNQLQDIMISHIATVVGHYKGQIEGWDVVNEPLADYGATPGAYGLRQNIWYKAMGVNYIAEALKAAHAADPSTGLWINEFGMESDDDRFNQMLNLVRLLQSQHVPLTGIGFQAHIDEDDTIDSDTHIDTTRLAARFATLHSLGLKARISELDITNEQEAPVYSDIVHTCLASLTCVGVTTWGVTDAYSSSGSLSSDGILETGTGLPWDDQEQPLAAVAMIRSILE